MIRPSVSGTLACSVSGQMSSRTISEIQNRAARRSIFAPQNAGHCCLRSVVELARSKAQKMTMRVSEMNEGKLA
jgi:hypothetical protein